MATGTVEDPFTEKDLPLEMSPGQRSFFDIATNLRGHEAAGFILEAGPLGCRIDCDFVITIPESRRGCFS